MTRFVIAAFLVVLTVPAAANSAYERFISESARRMDALRAGPTLARESGCRTLNRQIFDLASVARATAAGHWDGIARDVRNALADAVLSRLSAECLSALRRPHAGPPSIRRTSSKNGYVRVTVLHVDAEGKRSVVMWSLVPGGPIGMHAIDVIADGRGAVATLKADFEGALSANGGNVKDAIRFLAGKR